MRKIGRYKVRGRLGKGGMCTIYKVAMPVTGKLVALKLLTPPEVMLDVVGEKRLRELFMEEAVTMAHLRHPHIADVWDFDEHDGWPFFIMEYFCNNLGLMIGESEEEDTPSRPLSPEKIFRYGSQLLNGLSCLHQAGIIHRDIKPCNLLITDRDEVKIADFGLSKREGADMPAPEQIKIGSFHYAAPEQHKDPEGVDGRADIYSVGRTLYRMLYGRLPAKNESLRTGDQEDLGSLLHPFFRKATAGQVENRYQSAGEMVAELHRLEKEWRRDRELFCRIVGPTMDEPEKEGAVRSLRKKALQVAPVRARDVFGLDHLWRPVQYGVQDFRDNADGTVTDMERDLVWQQAGSDHPLTWESACDYIASLNDTSWAGKNTWRLPTVDELLSLLADQSGVAGLCPDEVFETTMKIFWSCDCRSRTAAWYVNLDMGYVHWRDYKCYYWVRAVRSL